MSSNRQLPPTTQDASMARHSAQVLSHYTQGDQPLSVQMIDADHPETIRLPAGAAALLLDILEAMAAGRSVTLISINAELTTVQAAEMLNVSRPFLIRLLESGQIPYRKVGKHRRVRLEDVLNYKKDIDRKREAVLDQLVAEAQEQGMGYD